METQRLRRKSEGKPVEMMGKPREYPWNPMETQGITIETQGIPMETQGNLWKPMEVVGKIDLGSPSNWYSKDFQLVTHQPSDMVRL